LICTGTGQGGIDCGFQSIEETRKLLLVMTRVTLADYGSV
jgi:hypothetical protein